MPNLLIDILKNDRSRVEQWHKALLNEELKTEFKKDQYLQRLGEAVEKYLLHGELSIQSITYGLEAVSKRMWKGFLTGNHRCIGELQKKHAEAISERIMKCTDASPIFLDCEIEELKNGFDLDREEVFRLKKYVMETAGYIREVLGKWVTILTDQKIIISDDTQKNYIQMMHDSLHERYVEALSRPNENEWIFTQKSQRLMVSLGIVNKDWRQFETALAGAVNAIDEQQFERSMQDRMMLYGEVFADLGMCKVLGFTPLGYLAYTIHLHMKESEMPKGIATNMLTERLKWVMYILQKTNEPNFSDWSNLEAQLEEYERKIESCDDSKETRMHQRMLKWMKHIYADMHLDYFPEETKMFSEHLQEMYTKPSMKALQDVRNPLLEEIGEYYNKFIENVNNPNAARRTMDIQNNFVLQYYGKMQDASTRIKRWKLSDPSQEDDFAVLYNRVFMQWDMEEMV